MNSIFRIRKLNNTLKIFSDSFIGIVPKEMEKDLKEFYENILKENNINLNIKFS
jgi:hypothetical protein